jgi:hypothetical protein
VGHLKETPNGKDPQTFPPQQNWPSCVNTSSSTCRFRISATSISSIRQCSTSGRKPSENGTTAFESRRPRSQSLSEEEDKIAALETKLRNKTEVLAEVVEELVRTKKELGES